jgi:putative transposase
LGLSKHEKRDLALAVNQSVQEGYPKRILAKAFTISRQSLYYKHKLPENDNELRKEIEKIYEVDDTLGCVKLAKLLGVNKKRTYRVMLKYGIKPRRKRRAYKYPGRADDIVENKLLEKDVRENTILFSDIFQFRLADGSWVYCCFVLRKHTRQILSFCYSWGMRAELVSESIKRVDLVEDLGKKDVIFHSDQGSQYGAKVSVDSIIEYKFERSMSRAGTPTDNAFAERFVGIFKLAVVERYSYANLSEFVEFASKWLNFYNNERPHHSLSLKSPNDFAEENDTNTIPYLFLNFV